MIRRSDLDLIFTSRSAVAKAMEKLHERNPAKYHADRPDLIACPFDEACPFTG